MNLQATDVNTSGGASCLASTSTLPAYSATLGTGPQLPVAKLQTPLSSRASEILESLKEQRESLLGRWNAGSSDGTKTVPALYRSVCGSPGRSMAIQKLQNSLKRERKSRLRMSKQDFLPRTAQSATSSMDGSDTGKRSVDARSTSTKTEETESSTTLSPISHGSASSVAIDATLFLNKSIHIPSVGETSKSVEERSRTDNTLGSTKGTVNTMEVCSPKVSEAFHSSVRLVNEIPLSPESLSCDEEDPELKSTNIVPPLSIPSTNNSANAVNVSPVPVTPTFTTSRNFDSSSRLSSNRSLKRFSMTDLDIPLELSPIDTRSCRESTSLHSNSFTRGWNSSPETCSALSDCSTLTTATATTSFMPLQTKMDRAAYIGQLYPPSCVSGQPKLYPAPIPPSTGLRRQQSNHINRVMVRGRVGILKPSNQRVFVTAEVATRTTLTGLSAAKKQTAKASSNDQLTPLTKDEESLSMVVVGDAANEPNGEVTLNVEQTNATTNESNHSTSSDNTSVDNSRKGRFAFFRHLEEDAKKVASEKKLESGPKSSSLSLSASSSTSMSSDYVQISDDSSCELTTTSEVSEWANSVGDSTLFLGNESLADTVSIMSGVTLPPLSPLASPIVHSKRNNITRRQVVVAWKEPLLSEIHASSVEEESINDHLMKSPPSNENGLVTSKSNLFVAGRAADSLCFANGGHFSIARKSGLVLQHNSTMKLVRLKMKPLPSKSVHLSTDLRCGTKGSLYDIAIRTGCNIREPYIFKRPLRRQSSVSRVEARNSPKVGCTPKYDTMDTQSIDSTKNIYLKARGGMYDTVLNSGLAREVLQQRAPLSVTTNQPSF